MPYFQCSRCQCVEDTSLCRYWSDRFREDPPVCSACDPDIGRWHDQFPRQYPEEGGWILDKRSGFFWQKGEVERWLGQPVQIIGRSDRSFSAAASVRDAGPSRDLPAA